MNDIQTIDSVDAEMHDLVSPASTQTLSCIELTLIHGNGHVFQKIGLQPNTCRDNAGQRVQYTSFHMQFLAVNLHVILNFT